MRSESFEKFLADMITARNDAIARGICVKCKRDKSWYSEAGKKEYYISGLCEECFDKITNEPEQSLGNDNG